MPSDSAATTHRLYYQRCNSEDMKRIYIQAAEQISYQQPLSEEWMKEPVMHDEPLVHAVNPAFRDYIPANEARRMGNLMKRALVTSLKVLRETGIEHPDAIVTGTSIGSLDYTERFLDALTENGEETLSPTYFMQSTHNTVGSALGIYTKTHSYNTTYSHGSLSFDLAVQDVWMQMQLGKISTALVGGHDEMVEAYFLHLQKAGYVGVAGMVPCGEVAMSMLLSTQETPQHLCELAGIRICHCTDNDRLSLQLAGLLHDAGITLDEVSAVMIGVNGNPENDKGYREMTEALFSQKPLLHYKHIFGENYTAPAFGLYAAAHCLHQGLVPSFMYDATSPCHCDALQSLLLVNQVGGKDYSLMLLKKI